MGQLKPNTTYIYESPDNGDTIFAREVGSTERTLVGMSFKKQKLIDEHNQKETWIDIIETSKNNPALQNALNNLLLIYKLSKVT